MATSLHRMTPWAPSADHPVLEVANLTGPAGAVVLHDISLRVNAGETHVVLGPIHSGKSMLVRHILGLERAEQGTISAGGETFDSASVDDANLRRVRRRIGTVFEGSALLSRLSVVENVELPMLEHGNVSEGEAREAAHKLLRDVDVLVDDDTLPAELGRAEQRRVALARALALEPAVVLLDAPSQDLDSHAAGEFDQTVLTLQQRHGCGVLIASHEVRYAFTRTSHIHVMVDGRIVANGDLATLKTDGHPAVRRLLERRGAR